MYTLEHPQRRPVRRRRLHTLLLALMAIAMPATFLWVFYGRFEWLVIVLSETALAYALVATLARMTPPPGATRPAHSFDK